MSQPKRVLLVTLREPGSANTHLAVAYELLLLDSNVEVHVASSKSLEKRVQEVSAQALAKSKGSNAIKFHALPGPSLTDSLTEQAGVPFSDAVQHGPAIRGTMSSFVFLATFAAGWRVEEHAEIYHHLSRLIKTVDPSLISLDQHFAPGVEAVRDSKKEYVMLSANTLKEVLIPGLPRLAGLWKYPIVGSGLPFPLPLYLIPVNLFLNVCLIACMIALPPIRNKIAALKKLGIKPAGFLLAASDPKLHWLVATRLEIDYPVPYVPANLTLCGPIVMDFESVEESDAELASWLARRPTVLINLGSLYDWEVSRAIEMAVAIRTLLSDVKQLQVLWKINRRNYDDIIKAISQVLGREMEEDQVRPVDWLGPQPGAILQTGDIVASVHHGGANSFNEAVRAGVPHVILPMWYDLYDFATKVEYLGIGAWGNKSSAPRWTAEELGLALLKVVRDEQGPLRAKAKQLSKFCAVEEGRTIAARKLLEMA